jgi:peptidoglycan hydrolase CwlO-like protein
MKLLEKTSSYIKSLKKAIDEKNKKIKVLEKKIESLKASELVRKGLGP